jgi:hypothetical protein
MASAPEIVTTHTHPGTMDVSETKAIDKGDIVLAFLVEDDAHGRVIDLAVEKRVRYKLALRIAPMLV